MTGINLFNQHVVEEKSPFDLNKLQNKFQQQANSWSVPEAFLCLLLASSTADGNYDGKEGAAIQAIASRSRALASVPAREFGRLNDVVNQRMAANPNALTEAAACLPSDMCLSVFAHCVDIVLADGELVKSEADFLNGLVEAMDIPHDHAKRILEVMLIKAQY
ncbi:MAG: tellurite resistance TerB family protein [Terricaulis sp.]